MPSADDLDALHLSDQRAVRTVDSLTDEQWSGPSALPGWTRAHVVAHLTLNAEGFIRAVEGLVDGEEVPTYDSNEARDVDIADLAAADPAELRDRFFAATQHFRTLFADLDPELWSGTIRRIPGGPVWPVARIPGARRTEVEVHHADLALGYTAADWPEDFVAPLLDELAAHHADSDRTEAFSMAATDLGRSWRLGADFPVVSGSAGSLAWWLLGRADGTGLTADGGLPAVGPW